MASDYTSNHLMAVFGGALWGPDERAHMQASNEESQQIGLYTSIPPLTKRQALGEEIGPNYQAECLRSWRAVGFAIYSLNQPSEIESLAAAYPDISFLPIESKRPKIIDFLNKIAASGAKVAGIVNADCFFLGSPRSSAAIAECAQGGLIMLERLNFSPESLRATGKSCHGFDAFIFDTKFISSLKMNPEISIGETWWDYWFPMAFNRAGGALKTSQSPLLFHLDHVQGWSWEQYNTNGLKLFEEFKSMYSTLPTWLQTAQGELIVGEFAYFCFDWIKSAASSIEFREGGISEKIASAFWLGVSNLAFEAEIAREEAQKAAAETRLHGIANKTLGQTLCTFSRPLKALPVVGRLARKLYSMGDDIQFRASRRDTEWQLEDAFIKEFFKSRDLDFLLVMPVRFGQFFHHYKRVKNLIGVDTSAKSVKSASSYIRPGPVDASTEFKNGDLLTFQFPNNLFDVATVQLYGFVPEPMLPAIVSELCRVTKNEILVRTNKRGTRDTYMKFQNTSYSPIETYFKNNGFEIKATGSPQVYEGISVYSSASLRS